ncbi:hypothetical protein MPLSOD_100388 [Mesorhizobium sp. SOD10]|nr:hypothetical protein MPLSOD_100388 [Mesorhizobium sp. SOD10]
MQRFRILHRSCYDNGHGMDPRVKPEDDDRALRGAKPRGGASV